MPCIRSSRALPGLLSKLRLFLLAALLTACSLPGAAAPVVKIGLSAPFEGLGRPLGYAVLPEVKAAIAEANASGALGRYRVALVALNDELDPATAAVQAQALAQDDAVLAAIGPFSQDTAAAAAPILHAAGIPTLIAAPTDVTFADVTSLCPSIGALAAALEQTSVDLATTFAEPHPFVFFPGDAALAAEQLVRQRNEGAFGPWVAGPDVLRPWFIERAGGAAEGTYAAACSLGGDVCAAVPEARLARAGAKVLLQALAADIQAHGRPSRAGVAAALARQGLTPQLRWYRVQDGQWMPLP